LLFTFVTTGPHFIIRSGVLLFEDIVFSFISKTWLTERAIYKTSEQNQNKKY